MPESHIKPEFLTAIKNLLKPDQIDTTGEIRLRHGHGHTQEEMYSIKYTQLGRIPDIVVFPQTEDEISSLVEAANKLDVSLIPYGGGTNVNDALRWHTDERRTIVSVGMSPSNRI